MNILQRTTDEEPKVGRYEGRRQSERGCYTQRSRTTNYCSNMIVDYNHRCINRVCYTLTGEDLEPTISSLSVTMSLPFSRCISKCH